MKGGRGLTPSLSPTCWLPLLVATDSQVLQTAADSCEGPCLLMLARTFTLGTSVWLNPNNGVFSTRGSKLVPGPGPGAQGRQGAGA